MQALDNLVLSACSAQHAPLRAFQIGEGTRKPRLARKNWFCAFLICRAKHKNQAQKIPAPSLEAGIESYWPVVPPPPVVPAPPEAPELPEAPDAPGAPGAPAAPEAPDAPDGPGAPAGPDAPAGPGVPEPPGTTTVVLRGAGVTTVVGGLLLSSWPHPAVPRTPRLITAARATA